VEAPVAPERSHTGLELYNRYRVGPLEARGALCAVFRGDDTVLRRPIAVKAVPPALVDTYRDALRACAALSHPAIVATYDAVRLDGWLYLVQEFVAARSLASYLDAGLPAARAVDLAAQIARVLAYAHAHGVTHGDLTPAAVLVDRRAAVRINNFGLPRDAAYFATAGLGLDDAADASEMPAADGGGTPATGSAEADVRMLGLILWQALSAPARSPQTENEPLDAGRVFRTDVPESLRALVRRYAGRSRGDGIVDAETALAELDAIAEELAQARAPLAEQTPPTIRAARAAIARVASWSADETQAGPRPWGDSDSSQAHSAPTIASPRYPSAGPLAVDAAPRLRLPARATGAPPASPGLRQRATAGPGARPAPLDPPTWPSRQRSPAQAAINFRMLLVVSVALFVLFFIIGFIAQPGIGPR
jgi:eukaryotic-like serine/threonine-protein kinase